MLTIAVQVAGAALLAAAGLLKLRDPNAALAGAAALGLPGRLTRGITGRVLLAVLIGTEVALAAGMVSPMARAAAGLAAGLLAVLGLLLVRALMRGGAVPCGCFGTADATATVWSTVRDLAVAPGCAAIAVGWLPDPDPGRRVWSWSPVQLAVAGTAVTVALVLAAENRRLRRAASAASRAGSGLSPDRAVLTTVGGRTVRWPEVLRHAPVLLVFVDPHCAPCERLLTQMAGWSRRGGSATLLLVSRGMAAANAALAARAGAELVMQQDFELAAALGIRGTPAAAAIDTHGRITAGPAHGVEGVVRLAGDLGLANHKDRPEGTAVTADATAVRGRS